MTEEELEKEAEEYTNKLLEDWELYDPEALQEAYIAGAELREKHIAELEKELAISEHDREHNDYELTEVYKNIAELEKENETLRFNLDYVKSVVRELLDNSNEYARQQAEDFIKG